MSLGNSKGQIAWWLKLLLSNHLNPFLLVRSLHLQKWWVVEEHCRLTAWNRPIVKHNDIVWRSLEEQLFLANVLSCFCSLLQCHVFSIWLFDHFDLSALVLIFITFFLPTLLSCILIRPLFSDASWLFPGYFGLKLLVIGSPKGSHKFQMVLIMSLVFQTLLVLFHHFWRFCLNLWLSYGLW